MGSNPPRSTTTCRTCDRVHRFVEANRSAPGHRVRTRDGDVPPGADAVLQVDCIEPPVREFVSVGTGDRVPRRAEFHREDERLPLARAASTVETPRPTSRGTDRAIGRSAGSRSRSAPAHERRRDREMRPTRSRTRSIWAWSSGRTGHGNSRPTRKCERSAVSCICGSASSSCSVNSRSVVARSRCVSIPQGHGDEPATSSYEEHRNRFEHGQPAGSPAGGSRSRREREHGLEALLELLDVLGKTDALHPSPPPQPAHGIGQPRMIIVQRDAVEAAAAIRSICSSRLHSESPRQGSRSMAQIDWYTARARRGVRRGCAQAAVRLRLIRPPRLPRQSPRGRPKAARSPARQAADRCANVELCRRGSRRSRM